MVEFGGPFTKTTGLTPGHWGLSIGIAAITMPLGVLMRYIPVPAKLSDYAHYFQSDFHARMESRRREHDTVGSVVTKRNNADTARVTPKETSSSSASGAGAEASTTRMTPRLALEPTGAGVSGADSAIGNPFSPTNTLSHVAFLHSGYTPKHGFAPGREAVHSGAFAGGFSPTAAPGDTSIQVNLIAEADGGAAKF
jgi:hypothetical protein